MAFLLLSHSGDYPGTPYARLDGKVLSDPALDVLLALFQIDKHGAEGLRELFEKLGSKKPPGSEEYRPWEGHITAELLATDGRADNPIDDKDEDEDQTRTTKARLKRSVFAVEATSDEQHSLWDRYSSESLSAKGSDRPRYKWEQVGDGCAIRVGSIGGRPIWVSLSWAIIEGQWVMFYYATSQVVDMKQVEAWLDYNFKAKWDNGRRRATTNTGNFHHALQAVVEANKAKAS